MIMKTLRYIALAAMTLSFAACTQEEDFTPQMDGDAVKINATIGAMQTRVAYSGDNGVTNFVNGDAIKVVNLMCTSKNEATYTTTDGTNWTTTDAMVWNSSSKNTFQAWYPVAEYSSYDAFTIPTDQGDATKLASADWMTASTGEIDKPGNGVLDLSFQHRLAKVTVTVSEFTSQYAEGATLSGATIYSLTADNVSVENADNGVTPYQEGNSVTAIVCPGKYNADATLMEINVKDENGNYTLAVPVNDYLVNTGLAAGSHYTFSLKVGKDVVAISSVTVEGWVEMEIDGGVAEEVTPTIDLSKYTDGETVNIAEDCRVIGDGNEYNLTLNVTDDAKVTFAAGASGVKLAAPITVADGKTLTLTIRDNVEHIVNGGISLGNGSNVIIEGERNKENNKLTVTATDGNAAIGANNGVTAGDITIRNARVEATGSSTIDAFSESPVSGAAIGTSDANMGDILIENSIITATGSSHSSRSSFAAAIGMGSLCRSIGNMVFIDSEITAKIPDETLASVIGAGSIMHGEKRLVCTMGDIIFTNTSLNLSIVPNLRSYGALIGIGETDSYHTVNMGKIIFTDMTQAELDAMIATWTYPEDFAEWGAYIIGRSPYNMVNENGTIEGVYVSDGNGGTVQVGNADGYNPTGYVTNWGWQ